MIKQTVQVFSAEPGGAPARLQVCVPVDKIYTVEEAREARQELSEAISRLVENFERRTLCPVLDIRPDGLRVRHGAYDTWNVEVKL